MIGYKLTGLPDGALKAHALRKEKYNGVSFNPVQDINGDWFIFEREAEYCVLHFKLELVEAEYVPPILEPLL